MAKTKECEESSRKERFFPMPYIHILDKDRKPTGIVHLNLGPKRNREFQYCVFCARERLRVPMTRLCDHRLASDKTCDVPMCDFHAKSIGPNLDVCPAHADKHKTLFEEVPA